MNKLKSLKFSELSKSELQAREMNKLLGGENCCICSCPGDFTSEDTGNIQHGSGGEHDTGGYGVGSYA